MNTGIIFALALAFTMTAFAQEAVYKDPSKPVDVRVKDLVGRMTLEEKNDVNPICPHCNKQLFKIWYREVESFFGKRYVYFCPECRKVLSISHRKGFWMG